MDARAAKAQGGLHRFLLSQGMVENLCLRADSAPDPMRGPGGPRDMGELALALAGRRPALLVDRVFVRGHGAGREAHDTAVTET